MSPPKVNIIQVKAFPKYHLQNLTQVFLCIGIHCLSLCVDVHFEENDVSVPTASKAPPHSRGLYLSLLQF